MTFLFSSFRDTCSSESEMKCKLHLAHGLLDICDLPGPQTVDCSVRYPEIDMVENVECLGAEFQRFSFEGQQVLCNGQIGNGQPRAAQGIAVCGSVPEGLLRLAECRRVEPLIAIAIGKDGIADNIGHHVIEIRVQEGRI